MTLSHRSLSHCLAACVCACLALPVAALDLLESYEAALLQDAEYQAARATAEVGREALPLARAQLLPNLSFNANRMRNNLTTETLNALGQPLSFDSNYTSKSYALTLRQPLYRPALLSGYRQAGARVASADAMFLKAGQDLALRVAGAYFNVLFAEESVRQVEAQGLAIATQLRAAERAIRAGVGTRTDIDDAQARLDLNQAKLLGARQQIDQARHELHILIGRPADQIRPLDRDRLALSPLQPDALDAWIERAEQSSPELHDLQARVKSARQDLARAQSGHKPTLDLIVQRTYSESDNVTNPNNSYDNSQIGVQLAIPLYAGGAVNAQVRQARAALVEAEQRLEAARRKLATQVRKEFQGVREGMLKVQALEAAERSAALSLASNEKGFLAGVRSRLDILNALEVQANARMELARERMLFVMSRIRLLGHCGALDRTALEEMNRWLAAS